MTLAYSSGGFLERQWLLPALATTLFAIVAFALAAYPERTGTVSSLVLGLLCSYGMWVAVSSSWAPSRHLAWLETNRTFFYVIVFALAIVYLRNQGSRRVLRYLLLAAGFLLAAVATYKLGTASDPASLFTGGRRLQYPMSYPNSAAALYLLLVWPLLWLASDPREYAPVRAVALGTVGSLMSLFVLTQSRGGLYALLTSAALLLLLTPARLRTLFYALVPSALLVWSFPTLNSYWTDTVAGLSGTDAAYRVLMTFVIGAFVCLVLSMLERWIDVSRRMRIVFGTIVVAGLVAGSIAVSNQAAEQTDAFTGLFGPSSGASLGVDRPDLWRVGLQTFTTHPWTGVGAGGYVFEYDRARTAAYPGVRHPHSLVIRVLAETGAVGTVLLLGALGVAIGSVLWLRFSRSPGQAARPEDHAFDIALMGGFLYWLIHAGIDWLWHMPGVTVGALLLLALGVARADARRSRTPRGETRTSGRFASGLQRIMQVRGPGTRLLARSAASLAILAIFASLALPYLSIRFQELALLNLASDPRSALVSASRAGTLSPFDPAASTARSDAYEFMALEAWNTEQSNDEERQAAALDGLALAVQADLEAVEKQTADWSLHSRAAQSYLDFLAARSPGQIQTRDLSDWGQLSRFPVRATTHPGELPSPGDSPASPAVTQPEISQAQEIRHLSNREIIARALDHLEAAHARNPLDRQVEERLAAVGGLIDQ